VKAERLADVLTDDRIVLELGRGLLPLVAGSGAPLVAGVQSLRSAVAADLGVVVPSVSFRDDLSLPDRGYRILIAGEPCCEAELPHERRSNATHDAELLGRSLETAVRQRADALLTRDSVARLIESLRAAQPAVVEQIVPEVLTIARIHRTLQCLLREAAPIRPLAEVLEIMADHAAEATEPAQLAELVRARLMRTICRRARDEGGRLVVVKLTEPATAALLAAGAGETEAALATKVVADVRRAVRPRIERGAPAVIVVPGTIRREIHELLSRHLPGVQVLAAEEVATEGRVEIFATVGGADASRAA
jgi:flagellar biosynthesis protein FlhA